MPDHDQRWQARSFSFSSGRHQLCHLIRSMQNQEGAAQLIFPDLDQTFSAWVRRSFDSRRFYLNQKTTGQGIVRVVVVVVVDSPVVFIFEMF